MIVANTLVIAYMITFLFICNCLQAVLWGRLFWREAWKNKKIPRIVVDSRILCDIESQWQMLGHPLQTPFCVLDGSFVLTIRFENAAIHKLFRNSHIIVRTKTLTKTAKEVFRGRRLFP